MKKNIAIITARGGSKGVLGKNLRLVGEKTLVERSVQSAKSSNIFDLIVVSTDDETIASEARRVGALVVVRPRELADDNAKSIDAVVHALEKLNISSGLCCLLQPTSPLRTGEDIRLAYDILTEKELDSVVSICECEHHPYKTLVLKNQEYTPILDNGFFEKPRQVLDKAFRINGAIYFNKVESIFREKTFFCGRVGFSLMSYRNSIDIDSEADLQIAEIFLKGEK